MVHQDLVPLVPSVSSQYFSEGGVNVSGPRVRSDARFRDRVIKFSNDMEVLLLGFPIVHRKSVFPVGSKGTHEERVD
eukprot:1690353-Ditylum_brightwellii.AAC.1